MKVIKGKFWRWILFLSFLLGAGNVCVALLPQGRIVGSSSVFPFSAVVVQNLFYIHSKQVPVVEKTGSGAGIKLFCGGASLQHPGGVNSSRPMSDKEALLCKSHGVGDILEVKLGYGGIILAVIPKIEASPQVIASLTLHEIFLALSKEVYLEGRWVPNPYTHWSQINPELPNREILFFGPPSTSGMRDALKEIIFEPDCGGKKETLCGQFREDGRYIEMAENTKLIIQKLHTNPQAIGILGYPFLEENKDVLAAIKIDGIRPSLATIRSTKYRLARPLYFYVKGSMLEKNQSLADYTESLVSEEMWHEDGLMSEKGLIVPSLERRRGFRDKIMATIPKFIS